MMDHFGHIAVAKHFLNANKSLLAKQKNKRCIEYLSRCIKEQEQRIADMEAEEVRFWHSIKSISRK